MFRSGFAGSIDSLFGIDFIFNRPLVNKHLKLTHHVHPILTHLLSKIQGTITIKLTAK